MPKRKYVTVTVPRHFRQSYRVKRKRYKGKDGKGHYRKAYVVKARWIPAYRYRRRLHVEREGRLYLIIRTSQYRSTGAEPHKPKYTDKKIDSETWQRTTDKGDTIIETTRQYKQLVRMPEPMELAAQGGALVQKKSMEFFNDPEKRFTTFSASMQIVDGVITNPRLGLIDGKCGKAAYYPPISRFRKEYDKETRRMETVEKPVDYLEAELSEHYVDMQVNALNMEKDYWGPGSGRA